MANESGHGGYRAPSTPAAVSGPGKYSRRTDGGPVMDLPNARYGEAADFQEIQSGAQLGGSPGGASAPPAQPVPMPVGLGEPSQYPDQPVTAGASAGPGAGPESLGLPPLSSDERADLIRRYGKYVPLLVRRMEDPTSSQDYRDKVRYLLSVIG